MKIETHEICTEIEKHVSVYGCHIGVTGSTLYGKMHSRNYDGEPDLDLILYTNRPINNFKAEDALQIVSALDRNAKLVESKYSRPIIKASYKGTEIDFIILQG